MSSTPQALTSDNASNKRRRDEDYGDACRNSPSPQPCSANTSRTVAQTSEGTRNGEVAQSLSSSRTTAPTSSSTAAHEPINANQKHEARMTRITESEKRNRRANIAKQVGHEVDSDGEREYWQAVEDHWDAEEARRQALSPEARRRENIEISARIFRDHIKPQLRLDSSGLPDLYHYPLFLLQTAPNSRNGATCKLSDCTDRIVPGQYRIALSPGTWYARSPGEIVILLKHLPFILQLERCCACRALQLILGPLLLNRARRPNSTLQSSLARYMLWC
jgi:hypothetical protein